jgi:acyl phosphate:glycerol-3-phosphate acyltransferase
MTEWLLIPLAYFLGSISSAIIVCKLMGLTDPREFGSGNPGATNVLRIGGKKAAAITLFGDALKGLVPVLIAKSLGVSVLVLISVAGAAFLGHLYPIFFGFKGGKGVATSCGVLFGLSWWLGGLVTATWLAVYKISGISSLSALITACLTPIYIWFLLPEKEIAVAAIFLSAVLIWRHKSNIQKLLAGDEN